MSAGPRCDGAAMRRLAGSAPGDAPRCPFPPARPGRALGICAGLTRSLRTGASRCARAGWWARPSSRRGRRPGPGRARAPGDVLRDGGQHLRLRKGQGALEIHLFPFGGLAGVVVPSLRMVGQVLFAFRLRQPGKGSVHKLTRLRLPGAGGALARAGAGEALLDPGFGPSVDPVAAGLAPLGMAGRGAGHDPRAPRAGGQGGKPPRHGVGRVEARRRTGRGQRRATAPRRRGMGAMRTGAVPGAMTCTSGTRPAASPPVPEPRARARSSSPAAMLVARPIPSARIAAAAEAHAAKRRGPAPRGAARICGPGAMPGASGQRTRPASAHVAAVDAQPEQRH